MYHHKTSNDLLFDELRNITWRLNLIRAYLDGYRHCGSAPVIQKIMEAEIILFDDVYIELRDMWAPESRQEVRRELEQRRGVKEETP